VPQKIILRKNFLSSIPFAKSEKKKATRLQANGTLHGDGKKKVKSDRAVK